MLLSVKKISLFIPVFLLAAAFAVQQGGPWKAPDSADQKKNPLTADAANIAAGKALFLKECASCHGKKGKGDGPSAATLDVPAGNFASEATQKQSDGALFWKTTVGRKPMPSFKKQFSETQIWQLVIFMRTLKK